MIDKRTIWQQTLGYLAEDILDLFASPKQPFPDNVSYPETPSMEALIKDRFDSLYLPEKRLVHLQEVIEENWTEHDERKLADLIVLFEWEILSGFGDQLAFNLDGASFEGLRQLASFCGAYLARVMGRVLRMLEMYEVFGDMVATMFSQLPARELGEAILESLTPAYLKAHSSVKYIAALFFQDRRMLREAEEILEALDDELSREIDIAISGMSSVELGNLLKHIVVDGLSFFNELFSSGTSRRNSLG